MRYVLFASLVIAFLSGCSGVDLPPDNRNFAIDTFTPRTDEVVAGEARARTYWAKHSARLGANPPYLAVETSAIFESEIVQNLWPKLINSETTTDFFAGAPGRHRNEVPLVGIMIFDVRTGHFIGPNGFVSVDKPQRGQVARWQSYVARYIGTGRY